MVSGSRGDFGTPATLAALRMFMSTEALPDVQAHVWDDEEAHASSMSERLPGLPRLSLVMVSRSPRRNRGRSRVAVCQQPEVLEQERGMVTVHLAEPTYRSLTTFLLPSWQLRVEPLSSVPEAHK